jgi:LysM repeat protein
MRDRDEIEAALERVKEEEAPGASEVAFVQDVRVAAADPEEVTLADEETALARLQEAIELSSDRAVIYIDGVAAVALPDEDQARLALDRVKADLAGSPAKLSAEPAFKEKVEVRVEEAQQDLWADVDTTVSLLKGEGGEEVKTHQVASGETAWSISQGAGVSVADLARLNPGTDLDMLRAGQSLKVGGAAEPVLTVVSEGRIASVQATPYETIVRRNPLVYAGKRFLKQPGIPGSERVTYRVRYENGRVVEREVLRRDRVARPRAKVVVVGSKPRPRR